MFLHQYPEKVFVTVSNVSEILGEWNSSPFLTSRASSKNKRYDGFDENIIEPVLMFTISMQEVFLLFYITCYYIL